jgi:hypothetical protein
MEVAKIKHGSNSSQNARPEIVYKKEQHVIAVNENAVAPADLRRNCRCAACVEEFTGRQILKPAAIPETIHPLNMYPTGNNALSVDWSDGYRSWYPYKQIRALVSSQEEEKAKMKTTISV